MTSSAPIKGIDQYTAQQLADLFKTLGDPTRLKILSLLAAEQELRVYDIADGLTMGQSAISHQLRVLRTSRLVKFRREGKEVLYALDDDHVLKLLGQGLEHVQHE
nr:metalloregulator ArsR/SmtB family transcription factor [uncultured Selenomonas sp.]